MAFLAAEFLDRIAARDRMERERIHVMVRGEVFAKFRIVGVQYVLGVGGRDIAAHDLHETATQRCGRRRHCGC